MPQATPSQYPRSDRAHCNLRNVLLASFVSLFFQYPRSDRAHCNSREAPPRGARSALSVSSVGSSPLQHLHKRGFWGTSVLSVSSVGSSPLQPGCGRRFSRFSLSFSILGRIEPTATRLARRVLGGETALSVSSVGSSPLQPPAPARPASSSPPLSVSSVGSSPLQLRAFV